MSKKPVVIGRVTRYSTRGFVGARQLPEPEVPTFGSFCKASAQQGQGNVIGLVHDIRLEDDEFTRQLAIASNPAEEHLADNRLTRLIPIEISCLSVGYHDGDAYHYTLPPQPPTTLSDIICLDSDEIRAFSASLRFIPLVFSAPGLPADDLLAAALRLAAMTRPESERRAFLVEAGRACAPHLADNMTRLDNLMRNLTE
ncbi:MAG: hypothetical protein PVJ32_03730 [Anaerolineales bacterium]|jgi:hypothetical protein